LLDEDDSDNIRISSITGEGVEELRSQLIEIIDADAIIDPLELPDDWHRQNESIEPIGSPEEIAQRREKAQMHAPKWEREMRKRK